LTRCRVMAIWNFPKMCELALTKAQSEKWKRKAKARFNAPPIRHMSGLIWNFAYKHGLRTFKKTSNAWRRYNAERPRWFMDWRTQLMMTGWNSWVYCHWKTEDLHSPNCFLSRVDVYFFTRDSRKSRQKNDKNHGTLLWKSQKSRQNHGSSYSYYFAKTHGFQQWFPTPEKYIF